MKITPPKKVLVKKEPVLFPCCGVLAVGFRGAHQTDSGVQRFAKCPRCGRLLNLGPLFPNLVESADHDSAWYARA